MGVWWGYRHNDGKIHLKRFGKGSSIELNEVEDSQFTDDFVTPFEAKNRLEALQILEERLEQRSYPC